VSGKLQYFNPAAERLTGWPAAEARRQDLARVLHAECEGAPDLIDRAVAWATEMGAAVTLPRPAWLLTRHGRRAAVEGSVAPVRDDAGAFTGYVCVVRDVSERQAADEQLRRSAEQFRRTQQRAAVSKVAADVSHDFNNLLTVILGNTSLVLCHLPEGDPRLPALLNVETAALSALDLVKRWQGFSRLTDPRQGPANLNVAVQKVWDNLRRLIDVPVALDFRPAPDLWPVQADAAAADEILTNLCINVCNALPRGGRLTLETENVTRAPDDAPPPAHAAGEFARLRLCDPSNGIAPLLRLGGAARHAGAAGATIPGLQEVFESVQRHGGWVDCVSDPRRGTRLDLLLPRARPDAPPQPAAVAVKERQYVPTVLFVDDEPLVRDLGRTVLERNGYRVLLAEDGAEALEVYRKDRHRIDLVILDLTMPALSGDDTFRRLVQLDEQVRVLFCSGYPADHVKSLGREQVVGFLSKPYRNEELLRAVEAALGRSIAGVAPPPPTAESFPQ
jgi:PAS domain S-box-containing protein